MAKKLIKKYLPDPNKIKNNKWLKIFGKRVHDPNLWHFNRFSVATACSVGLFIGYLPLPGHMITAAFFAMFLRANLPVSVLLVWIANPFTYVPMFSFAYALGASLMGIHASELDFSSIFKFHDTLEPLFLGSIICGGVLALLGNIGLRVYWRYSVSKSWRKRQLMRVRTLLSLTPEDKKSG